MLSKNKCPVVLAVFMVGLSLMEGCHPTYVNTAAPNIAPLEQRVTLHRRMAGYSLQNRPIPVIEIGNGSDVTLIIATIHGNENAGTPLTRELVRYLSVNFRPLYRRKVVIMPLANPDGMALHQRGNSRKIDLNRNFPATNRKNNRRNGQKALTEPESRTILRIIQQYHPDRIISIHQPLGCLDYDGPAAALAQQMAQHCDLAIRKLGAKPGSLGSYAGQSLKIPIVTMELRPIDSHISSGQLWKKYGAALLAAISYPEP